MISAPVFLSYLLVGMCIATFVNLIIEVFKETVGWD